MVVPWLLYWCLTLVKDRRVSWLIVPTMVVLVDAHSAVALVSTIVLVVTAVTFLASFGVAGFRAVYRRLLIAAGATTVILAPMLVAELEMSRFYDPASKITEFGATVSRNFTDPWWSYFLTCRRTAGCRRRTCTWTFSWTLPSRSSSPSVCSRWSSAGSDVRQFAGRLRSPPLTGLWSPSSS